MRIGLCLTIAALLLTGCRRQNPAPVPPPAPSAQTITLRDQADRTVTLPQLPRRIISLAPSTTESLFALGVGDRVIGVTTACNYPPEAQEREKVGGFQLSIERVISLNPDLVIAVADLQAGAIETLEGAGEPLLVIDPDTFDKLYESILIMGRATGAEERAESIVGEMKAVRQRIREAAARIPEGQRPRVFIEIGDQPLRTAGPGTFVSQIVEDAGGRNIAEDVRSDWGTFSYEAVIARDPEVIISTIPGDVEGILQREGWSTVSAIKSGRVYAIDPDLAVRPGPRLKDGLEAVFEVLHPERQPPP